jgi:hypothetical protein
MAERRALIEGVNPVEEIDRALEAEFVHGRPPRKAAKPSAAPAKTSAAVPEQPIVQTLPPHPEPAAVPSDPFPFISTGRVAIGARVRPELAAALKRTSLERQLKGIQPFAVQEILEEALELWLHHQRLLK